MSRGVGEAELAAQLSETVVGVAGVVTQFGDMWFVLVAIVFLWGYSRWNASFTENPLRDCLYLLALAMGSYALTVVLKQAFALPRPPGAATATAPGYLPSVAHGVYESMVTGTGYGFPSGHALKTTAVYGGAALTLTAWNSSQRLMGSGIVVGLVAASRVVLGVHYLVDVVVGVLVGVVFLAAVDRLTHRRPGRALVVSLAVGLLALGTTVGYKAGLVVLVSLVTLLVWRWWGEEATRTSPADGAGQST